MPHDENDDLVVVHDLLLYICLLGCVTRDTLLPVTVFIRIVMEEHGVSC